MSTKLTCMYCARTFEGKGKFSLGRVRANLVNHIKGAHPDKYVPSKWVIDRKARDKMNQPVIRPQILISGPDPETAKRPYARKTQSTTPVCFCPKCGCNIRAVQVAMGI